MNRRGFTLIELSVALAIAAVMFGMAVVSIGALTGSKARAAAGELGGVIRSLYDTAALSGRTCRLVFELPAEKDDDSPATYRAECAAGALATTKDRDEELREVQRAEEEKAREGDKAPPTDTRFRSPLEGPSLQELVGAEKDRVEGTARFSGFTDAEFETRKLPSSVKLSVWTQHQRSPVRSGTAFLYFFPQGFTEKAHLYVSQGDNVWTITVAPLTGKTSVVSEELEVPRS